MSVEVTTAWVLAWMVRLLPPVLAHGVCEADKTVHHWEESYATTAEHITQASNAAPLFVGVDGSRRTAATLLAWAFFESRFDPKAIGDNGSAFGLYQVHLGTPPKGTSREDLFDPPHAVPIALALFRQSFRICSRSPWEERGAWFAAGGDGCKESGKRPSRLRMSLAARIVKEETP
jgi:hypothetical protein